FKICVRYPHGQHIFIKTIPFNAFRMTAVNYPIKVHRCLLPAILNPSRAKWLRLALLTLGNCQNGVLWYTLQVMKILRPILNLVNCLDYLPATMAATLLGGVTGGENSVPR